MRPLKLELEGFASFRERTVIDFDGADLFVLTGPTGAGKSTVIDAITFALYGNVPRYEDKRMVAPVISQGLAEARVRLDFQASGQGYSVVRIVRRSKGGAGQRAATLEEASGRVIANSASELDPAIAQLIGLPYEQFIRCVVLPQGDFAAFLHAPPAERGNLLTRLLGLELYERLRKAAAGRAAGADLQLGSIESRLERLADATPEALENLRHRVEILDELAARIELALPILQAEEQAAATARTQADQAEVRARRLGELRVPGDVHTLAQAVQQATDTLEAAQQAAVTAAAEREAADADRAALGDRGAAEALLRDHGRARRLQSESEAAAASLTAASEREQRSVTAATAAAETERDAADALEALRREHAAFHLAASLEPGHACPVCLRPVSEKPTHTPPETIGMAETRLAAAKETARKAREAEQAARAALAGAQAAFDGSQLQLARLQADLTQSPPVPELEALLGRMEAADRRLQAARAEERQVQAAFAEIRRLGDEARSRLNDAWRTFHATRDGAAHSAPEHTPPAPAQDLALAWSALVAWAAEQAQAQRALAELAREAADRHAAQADEIRQAVTADCERLAVDPGPGDPRVAVVRARERADAQGRELQRRLDEAGALREERVVLAGRRDAARTLERHLNARNFEAWLLTKALRQLIADASEVLRGLSSGAYSLALNAESNTFEVIDHRNADERRSARTLSGGETFLASLSLALALSDHIAQLAAGTTARLDALFLDEGFGTLDPETLDTVATAIEELGARGRMVGLVTHVRELADRIPVRFEVRRSGAGSVVERRNA
jgi:exonuclease SbcC